MPRGLQATPGSASATRNGSTPVRYSSTTYYLWIDFPGIPDVYMRGKDSDYLENSRRAALV